MAYLDHAATTPLLPEVVDAISAEMSHCGNASSLHAAGRRARRLIEESRETVARVLGARPSEVIFTSGGTEADNLAVKGLFWARRAAEPRRRRIIASSVEHHAVLDSVEWLVAHEGAEATWLVTDAAGRVSPTALESALGTGEDVALVTVMTANNEVGTVQPIAELAAVAHAAGVPLHTDAVQAVGQLPVDFSASGVDAMTVTGHKFGGPTGVGVLLLGRDVACVPVLHGGGQERDIRSGTLDAAGIVGFAVGIEAAVATRPQRAERLATLRDELVAGVLAAVPDAVLNGEPVAGPERSGGVGAGHRRLPGNAHFSFPGCEGDALLMLLDAQGVECSTGSACSAGVARPSHVLLAMGADEERGRGSLRFSLGHSSTRADVRALTDVIAAVVDRARRAGVATPRATSGRDPLAVAVAAAAGSPSAAEPAVAAATGRS